MKITMKLITQNKDLKLNGTTACVKFFQLKICILEVFQQIQIAQTGVTDVLWRVRLYWILGSLTLVGSLGSKVAIYF